MSDTRYVKPNPAGGWDVLKDGDRRSSVHAETESAAVTRARALVRLSGGGEVRVMNRAGKVVGSKTVARPAKARGVRSSSRSA